MTNSAITFDGPLDRLSLQPMNYTAAHYTLDGNRDKFNLNAPYQRGSVWSDDQRRNLIRSMFLGLPIGSVVLNDTGNLDREDYITVVDGKQRIETVRAFVTDRLAIPSTWIPAIHLEQSVTVDGWPVAGVLFSGLSLAYRRKFTNLSVPALVAHVDTVEQEAEVFRLINAGGVPQTAETMARAADIEAGR